MTAAYRPHGEWAHDDLHASQRQALVSELVAISRWELTYGDTSTYSARVREIQAALSAAPTSTEKAAA